MASLDLIEFHAFLEQLIDQAPGDGRRWTDRIVSSILTDYPDRLQKVQTEINALGIRALIRNNCRAKTRSTPDNQLSFFEGYRVSKRLSVPYHDADGKLRWRSKRREEISFEELDSTIARWTERPTKPSKALQGLIEVAKRTERYRGRAKTLAEAFEMALADDL